MNDAFVLIGGERPADPIAWARVGPGGALLDTGEADATAPAALAMASPARTVLVVPGSEAQLKRLDVPARTEAQARSAAQHMLEGSLAGGEELHYAVGAALEESGSRLVAVMDRSRLDAWLARARGLGLDPHAVLLDSAAWPTPPGEIHIVETPHRAIIAGGRLGGFTLEPSLAPSVFSRWLAQTPQPVQCIRLYGGSPERWSGHAPGSAAPIAATDGDEPFAILAAAAAAPPDYAPNLRQGDFAPAGKAGSPIRVWRLAAALAIAALALQIGGLTIAGWRDRAAAAAVRAEAEEAFRAVRPDIRRIVNLEAQVRALNNAAQRAEDHPMASVNPPVIAALQAHPLARLDEARHQAPNAAVRMVFSAPDAQSLEAVAQALRSGGVQVTMNATRTVEGRFVAEMDVQQP